MLKYLYFSDFVKPIAKKLYFIAIVLSKFCKLIFSKNKCLEFVQLDYSQKYLFGKSYLVVTYKFQNALWYNFKNITKKTGTKPIIFDLNNIRTDKITLIVHGLFQKKIYHLQVNPELILESNTFKTTVLKSHLNMLFISPFEFITATPVIRAPRPKLKSKSIQTNHSPYIQNEFL